MKKITTFLLSILSFCAIAQNRSMGKLHSDVISIGAADLKSISYTVYYPPDYDESPSRKYPVVYFLAGAFDQNDWINHGEVNKIFDNVIAEAKTPPFIGVMLCGAAYKSKDWGDLFENYIIKYVENRVRSYKGDKSKRAIIGFSLGGYYAIRSSIEMNASFSCSVAFCPLYLNSKDRPDLLSKLFQEHSKCDVLHYMLSNITELKDHSTKHQLIITSDTNFAREDFDALRTIVDDNRNSQVWIRNGEHDWDFAIRNLEPALEFVGDVFFGRLN